MDAARTTACHRDGRLRARAGHAAVAAHRNQSGEMNTIARDSGASNRRRFFVAMACAIIVAVFAGFAPTFYLRGSFVQTRPMSVLLHVHGIVFSAWVSFFLIQTLLIARG